jgi:hypothetical protein
VGARSRVREDRGCTRGACRQSGPPAPPDASTLSRCLGSPRPRPERIEDLRRHVAAAAAASASAPDEPLQLLELLGEGEHGGGGGAGVSDVRWHLSGPGRLPPGR